MDAQDFRSLQEAYVELYERIGHDGSFHRDTPATNLPPKPELPAHMKRTRGIPYTERETPAAEKTPEQIEQERTQRQKLAKTLLRQPQKEQVDLYDIILSHLLDEGYAETPEAAEVIMVNMSEEWRQSIIG